HAAARIVGYSNRTGGWMDAVQPDFTVNRDVNGSDKAGLRAAVRLQPNERFSITPRIFVQRVRADGWNRIDAFNILANPYTTSRRPVTLGNRQLFTQINEPYTDDFLLGDVNWQYKFGGATLTSITSYTHRNILVVRDATALPASVMGGTLGLSDRVCPLDSPLHQYAGFGEATLSATDRVDLTAGLRYYNFNENRSLIFDGAFAVPTDTTGTTDASGVAPRFIVSYKASNALTLNAQASRGFRLG